MMLSAFNVGKIIVRLFVGAFVMGLRPQTITALVALSLCLPMPRLAAQDGTIALDMIEKTPDIDVMSTNVILPGGMSGRKLAEEVATRRPELEVIYASGSSANVITHDGQLDEDVELLTKPYRRDILAQALRKALGDGAG